MPYVFLRGNLQDFANVEVPSSLAPRLMLRPNRNWIASGGSTHFAGENVASWTAGGVGSFEFEKVWSEPNDPRLWYTLVLDYLEPGQETEPPENRARAFFEWPYKIYPGEGGNLGAIIGQQVGLALVYAAPNAPNSGRWNQIHWNTSTGWVYEREWTP